MAFFAPDDTVRIFDSLFYVSPVTVAAFLILSNLLHLCKWHKMACVLPILPQVVSFVDYYIIELSQQAAELNILVTGSMAVLLILTAYKTFFK